MSLDGFTLHAAVRIPAREFHRRERLSQRGTASPAKAHVNSPDYTVYGTIDLEEEPTTNLTVSLEMWIALRDGDGHDPVDVLDAEISVLRPQVHLGTSLTLGADQLERGVMQALPLPDDPELEGAVMLYQWAVWYGNDFSLSDVFGTAILPSPSAQAGTRRSVGEGLRPEERNARLSSWLSSHVSRSRGGLRSTTPENHRHVLAALRRG